MNNKKSGSKLRKFFIARLEELCNCKDLVEIITSDRRGITGRITEVGEDYIGVIYSIEEEVTQRIPKEDGGTTPENQIITMELETFLRFTDFSAISRIKNKVIK